MECVKAYEDIQNGLKRRSYKKRKGKGGEACQDDAGTVAPDVISSTAGRQIEAKKALGILWPSKLFEKEKGRQPKKEELSTWKISGETVVGVLRDPAHGNPPGTYQLSDVMMYQT
eukprot:4233309-Alexandrium_andersonii.AAC.1